MRPDRVERFERLARIEKWRSQFTWSVVRPTTFRGNVAETVVAFKELAVVARRRIFGGSAALVCVLLLAAGWFALTNAIDAHHREPSTHTPVDVAWLPDVGECVPQPAPPTWACGQDDIPVLFCDGVIRCWEGWQR